MSGKRGVPLCPDGLLIAAVAVLTVLLRCIHLSEQSVWYDEYITVRFTNAPSLMECLRQQLQWDWHMVPVYHTLEYYTAQWSGGSLVAVRGLSVLFAAGAAVFLYLIGRRMFGRWAGTVAAVLFAMSPFHIFHGQEIRPYALVTLLALCSVYALVRAVSGDGRRWWALHLAANVLLMWTHLLAAIFLAPAGLLLLLTGFRKWKRNLGWGVAHIAVILLVLLWIAALQGGMESPKSPPPTGMALWADLFHKDTVYLHWVFGALPLDKTPEEVSPFVNEVLTVQPRFERILAWVFVAACAFLMIASALRGAKPETRGGRMNDPQPVHWAAFLLLLFAGPSLILFALTWVTHLELFQARFSIYGSPALYLMAGGAVALLGSQSESPAARLRLSGLLRAAVAAAIVALMGVQTVLAVQLPIRQNYLAAAKTLRAEKGPEEKLVAHNRNTQWLLAYSLGQPAMEIVNADGFEGLCNRTDELLLSGQPFWVVLTALPTHYQAPADISGLAEFYTGVLNEVGACYTKRRFLGMQNVYLFHVTAPPGV